MCSFKKKKERVKKTSALLSVPLATLTSGIHTGTQSQIKVASSPCVQKLQSNRKLEICNISSSNADAHNPAAI